jgi:DNA-binding transcriptional LysR family regulator
MNPVHAAPVESLVADRKLRVFVAVGEQLSFTDAGRQLGISQPAVSHAVRSLETALETNLFHRDRNRITLTSAGMELLSRLRAGFELIDGATRDCRANARTRRLVTLSVGSALATYWLLPRLAEFRALHPSIEIAVVTRDTDLGVGDPGADLWIPLGLGHWSGLREWHFADERIVPVAAPDVANALEDITDPAALLAAPLLHNEERYESRFDWHQWFAHHGVDTGQSLAGQRSNDYSVVLHAALAGQGVALGWLHVVQSLIDDGALVAIHGPPVTTNHAFSVVARPDALRRTGVDELRRWLLAQRVGIGTIESPTA